MVDAFYDTDMNVIWFPTFRVITEPDRLVLGRGLFMQVEILCGEEPDTSYDHDMFPVVLTPEERYTEVNSWRRDIMVMVGEPTNALPE